jgi:hypothetical protein
MSTSAVSSSSLLQELQGFYQNRQADVKQLGNALQSGDLNGAQQAYNTLAALGRGGPFAGSQAFSNSSRGQAFNAIGQALQSGDLAGAQAAFSTLTGPQSSSGGSGGSTPATTVSLTGPVSYVPVITGVSSIYDQLKSFRQQRTADVTQLGQDLQAGDLNAAQQDFSTLTALGQNGPAKNGQVFQQAAHVQDLQAVGQALQSGDLASAQSAFTTLASTLGNQNPQVQKPIPTYNGAPTEIIIINVGNDAGNTVGGGTVANPSTAGTPSTGTSSTGTSSAAAPSATGSSGSSTPEIVIKLGQAGSSSPVGNTNSNNEEITINLGTGSSGTQITIDQGQSQGQTQNGSPANDVTINFNPQNSNSYELILNLLNSGSTSPAQSGSNTPLSVSA